MKKILFFLTILLLFFGISFASDDKSKFLNYIQKNSVNFNIKQSDYYKHSLNQSEIEKEKAFKILYTNYIAYYNDIVKYYSENVETYFDTDYVKKYNDEYKKYGLGFNIPEGNWDIEEDYSMLMNTSGIPNTWLEWLSLQQKYIAKNRVTCTKGFLKESKICEGGTMTNADLEKAIVDLGKVEQKSEVIASIKARDYDFIPHTSKELLCTYLLGHDLRQIFYWDENGSRKLKKDSIKSFKHFIKHHKDSKYWNIVNEYYNKLEQNNFMYSDDIALFVLDKLD